MAFSHLTVPVTCYIVAGSQSMQILTLNTLFNRAATRLPVCEEESR
jgi:hypothetical protein